MLTPISDVAAAGAGPGEIPAITRQNSSGDQPFEYTPTARKLHREKARRLRHRQREIGHFVELAGDPPQQGQVVIGDGGSDGECRQHDCHTRCPPPARMPPPLGRSPPVRDATSGSVSGAPRRRISSAGTVLTNTVGTLEAARV